MVDPHPAGNDRDGAVLPAKRVQACPTARNDELNVFVQPEQLKDALAAASKACQALKTCTAKDLAKRLDAELKKVNP